MRDRIIESFSISFSRLKHFWGDSRLNFLVMNGLRWCTIQLYLSLEKFSNLRLLHVYEKLRQNLRQKRPQVTATTAIFFNSIPTIRISAHSQSYWFFSSGNSSTRL